ncbi:Methyltransferase domain-containing protein [Desulfonauticus submarinus]|uniref:Methyltransferase domain-containing protein n=1 Tax=Desulfonauticus submarinus TaxID=206665 RepID=A0A1H0BF83_9BACT|nr:class I SAM-dependent methyltransferase [Desulfonauticus submarinus]SDN44317.1 Methyltransferase domain-containing protein [Desulfonauticus submarinus]
MIQNKNTVDLFAAIVKDIKYPYIAEVGVAKGNTSLKFAKILDNNGEIHLFDRQHIVEDVYQRLSHLGYKNIFIHGCSNKLKDSYNWDFMKIIRDNINLKFDYIYLDGAHTWEIDGFAFFLCDMLLKVGGFIDFDDYYWTFSNSPTCNPAVYPNILEYYTAEQISIPQIKLVVDLLVKRSRRYKEVVSNKLFVKSR